MTRLFILLLLVALPTEAVYAQERTIDLKEIGEVVSRWSEAHNTKSLTTLEGLYSDEVMFYAKQLPRISCLGIKSKRLQSDKYFHQEIITQPSIKVFASDVIRASFVKRVTSGTKVTDYDAYLLLKRENGSLRIVGESDLIEDGNAKFIPDLGPELKVSRLSDSRLKVLDEKAVNDTTEPTNNFLLILMASLGFLVVLVLSYAFYRKRTKVPVGNEYHHATGVEGTHSGKSIPEADGRAFEEFVVHRFSKKYFELREWRSDKISKGVYPKSAHNPDLEFLFRLGDVSVQFAMECKYRKSIANGRVQFKRQSLENYRKYQKQKQIPVYIVLGLGGIPSAPADLFILPLKLFGTKDELGFRSILDYWNNPNLGFFLDHKTREFKWIKKPGS